LARIKIHSNFRSCEILPSRDEQNEKRLSVLKHVFLHDHGKNFKWNFKFLNRYKLLSKRFNN
jgi:hypothetical protein